MSFTYTNKLFCFFFFKLKHSAISDHRESSGNSFRSGFWISPLDYHGSKTIYSLPALDGALPVLYDEQQPYCGLPFYFPTKHIIKNTFWIDGEKPIFKHSVLLENWKTVHYKETTRLFFRLTGLCEFFLN